MLAAGISTIVFFAYTLLVMGPEFKETGSYRTAWSTGVFAAFATSVLELMAIPLVHAIRNFIPRAALRASVAGVAFTAITMVRRVRVALCIGVRSGVVWFVKRVDVCACDVVLRWYGV